MKYRGVSRFIIECQAPDLDFAWRALEASLSSQLAKHSSFIMSYSNEAGPDFYVKHNKKSISIRATKRA